MRLFLVRHGETFFNDAGRIQGWMDPGLNVEGQRQVKLLVDHLPEDRNFRLVTSPLRRALESARILRESLDLSEETVIDELRELNQGYWNGLRSELAESLQPERFRQWQQSPLETHPPAGESLQQLKERVRIGLEKILEGDDGPVLVVGHKVVNSMLLHLAGDCPFSDVMDSLPENAAVFEIDVDPGCFREDVPA